MLTLLKAVQSLISLDFKTSKEGRAHLVISTSRLLWHKNIMEVRAPCKARVKLEAYNKLFI